MFGYYSIRGTKYKERWCFSDVSSDFGEIVVIQEPSVVLSSCLFCVVFSTASRE
jgi:hypothetical protein